MSTKRNENDETRPRFGPNAALNFFKAIEPEITVQDPSEPSKRTRSAPAPSNAEVKNFPTFHPQAATTSPPNENPLVMAEQLMSAALLQLQEIYNAASKAKGEKITVERTTIGKIGTGFEQALEQIKTAKHSSMVSPEHATVLQALQKIQASVNNLEQKYEAIEAKVTDDLDAIQTTIREAPKTYAAVAAPDNTKAKKVAEIRAQRQKQREALRQERSKYEVTLTTKGASDEAKKSIMAMSPRDITQRCQSTIDSAGGLSDIKLQGINKLVNGIRVQCATEDQAKKLHSIDWTTTFNGVKIHVPNHGVVSHGIAIDELDLTDPKTIKLLEVANNLQSGVITNITPLRRKNKAHSENVKHYSIVIYTNDRHVANKLITNGIYINYLLCPAERFTPQFQKTQCFNCCDYGHRACQCKRNSRCGKCGEKHNTRECKSTVVKCALCKGDHEAWHHECPASLAESNRLEEMKDNASHLF